MKADGRRFNFSSSLLPFGFKTPAKLRFGGLQLVAGQNPPLIDPSALCPLPSAFFNSLRAELTQPKYINSVLQDVDEIQRLLVSTINKLSN